MGDGKIRWMASVPHQTHVVPPDAPLLMSEAIRLMCEAIRLTSWPRMRHSLARSASETVLETAPSLVALADLHVQASAIRKRFASIEMSEHLMREAIRCHQRQSGSASQPVSREVEMARRRSEGGRARRSLGS